MSYLLDYLPNFIASAFKSSMRLPKPDHTRTVALNRFFTSHNPNQPQGQATIYSTIPLGIERGEFIALPTILEACAVFQSKEPSPLLSALESMSYNQQIADKISHSATHCATCEYDSTPPTRYFDYSTKHHLCQDIQALNLNPIIIDQGFTSQFGQGDTAFAPSNLRIIQPAFVPLLCALDLKLCRHFGAEVQITNRQLGEQCGDLFAPSKPLPNAFIFAGAAGIGKTELLGMAIHRAAKLGKNLVLVHSAGDRVSCTHVDLATSTANVYTQPLGTFRTQYGTELINLYRLIEAVLREFGDGKDTVVVIDPPECPGSQNAAQFKPFEQFARQRLQLSDLNFGLSSGDVVQTYNAFYSLLSTTFPNTFFTGAHTSLPRQCHGYKGASGYSEAWACVQLDPLDTATLEPPRGPGGLQVSFLDPHITYPALKLTPVTIERTCKLILLRKVLMRAEAEAMANELDAHVNSLQNTPTFSQQQHQHQEQQSGAKDAKETVEKAKETVRELEKFFSFAEPGWGSYYNDVNDEAIEHVIQKYAPEAQRQQLFTDAHIYTIPTYRSWFRFLSLIQSGGRAVTNTPALFPGRYAKEYHVYPDHDIDPTLPKMIPLARQFHAINVVFDFDDTSRSTTSTLSLFLQSYGYHCFFDQNGPCAVPPSDLHQATIVQLMHPRTQHAFALKTSRPKWDHPDRTEWSGDSSFEADAMAIVIEKHGNLPPSDSMGSATWGEIKQALHDQRAEVQADPTQAFECDFTDTLHVTGYMTAPNATQMNSIHAGQLFSLGRQYASDPEATSNVMVHLPSDFPLLNSLIINKGKLFGIQISDSREKLKQFNNQMAGNENFTKMCLGLLNGGIQSTDSDDRLTYGGFIYLTTLSPTGFGPPAGSKCCLHTYTSFQLHTLFTEAVDTSNHY